MAKIVLIGVGSHAFGPMTLRDLMQCEKLRGSEVALVDIAADKLERMTLLAERMNATWGAEFELLPTTDRREALPDADIVITSIEREHYEMWQLDIEIPRRLGTQHLYGENGGPGGMFHTFRQVPPILEIAGDMERLCPDAWLVNMSNPESRLCLALSRYTDIKNVGVCLGAYITQRNLAQRVLGRPRKEIDIKVAGINHCHWVLDVRDAATGEDLYPEVTRRIAEVDTTWEPLSRECLRRFGCFPGPADNHVMEYLSWGWQFMPPDYTAWIARATQDSIDREADFERLARADGPLNEDDLRGLLVVEGGQRWQTLDIVLSLLDNGNRYVLSLNVPNEGYVTNLQQGGIVEIPAVVAADRIHGLGMGELPTAIAAVMNLQLSIMDLVVDAAVTGDRQMALEALIIDPTVPSPEVAEAILEEMIAAQAHLLPQFA